MVTPDSERNAGFTPSYQPLLALSAYEQSRQRKKTWRSPFIILPISLNPLPPLDTPPPKKMVACGPRELSTRLATKKKNLYNLGWNCLHTGWQLLSFSRHRTYTPLMWNWANVVSWTFLRHLWVFDGQGQRCGLSGSTTRGRDYTKRPQHHRMTTGKSHREWAALHPTPETLNYQLKAPLTQ